MYEIDKKVGNEPALHKNNSMTVVAIAAKEYFLNDTPVEETIRNHKNIYDFCITKHMNKGWFLTYQATPDSQPFLLKNIKTLKYYVSNSGGTIYKNHIDGRINYYLEAPLKGKGNKNHYWKLKMFNKFRHKEDYEIDYSYYIREANKLINGIK